MSFILNQEHLKPIYIYIFLQNLTVDCSPFLLVEDVLQLNPKGSVLFKHDWESQ